MQSNLYSKDFLDRFTAGYKAYLWLSVIVFMLYFQSLFFQYTFFDDHILIKNRLDFFNHGSGFFKLFHQDAFNNYQSKFYYRPILIASFFIDGWLSSGKFWVFHLSNILYHLIACWLVLSLLKKISGSDIKSFLLTAIFAVHPVITQVVSWIPGRNDSLLTIFLILSFMSYIKYLEKNKIKDLLFSLLLFIFSLLIKELAVFFPIVIFFYVLFFKTEKSRKLIIPAIFWIILIMFWAVVRQHVLGKVLGETNLREMSLTIFQNILAVPAYLGKIFIPYNLSVYPDLKHLTISIIFGIAVISGMIWLYFNPRSDKKMLLFGALWFLILLLPGFIKAANLSEHRIYLPMIGILIFLSGISIDLKKPMFISAFIIVWIILVSINISYSRNFKDRLTLWQQAVKSSPSSAFNANNLGAMYYLDHDLANAEKNFRIAVMLNPSEPLANGNLGLVLMNTDRFNEAEVFLSKEIKVNPKYDNAYFNLGILSFRKGDMQSGEGYMIKTINLNPGYIDAYRYLIKYYQISNLPESVQRVMDFARNNGVVLK